MVRIAIASTDGKIVNQHFGKCDVFYILDVDEDNSEIHRVQKREVEPICKEANHHDNKLLQTATKLNDCQIMIVSRIGNRARMELEKTSIEVYELPGIIEDSLDKVIRYRKVQNLFRV